VNDCNPFGLAGKTILVTGASSGIGRATAVECAKLGAKLILTGRDAERLQATFARLEGEGHRQILADLTSDEGLAKLSAASPALDGVVLCAGVGMTLPISLSTKQRFTDVFDVNFNAPVELLRQLLKAKKIVNAGSVVFVSSVAGQRGGTGPGNSVYAASKAALDAVMRHCVREYSVRKIRFNTVNPGRVNTPLVQDVQEKSTEEMRTAALAAYPLGRYGEPEDIAHGIVYLLSDASSWVTGHQLVIDGGLTV